LQARPRGTLNLSGKSGGIADKYGNRLEGRWTVHCFVELLKEHADKIDLEPPGEWRGD
jgi:hypothetical protein